MKKVLKATTAGAEACRRFSSDHLASVLGETSLGIFLRLAPAEVVFLSRERWRGPLTVNVPDLPHLSLTPGDSAVVRGQQIQFETGLTVSLQEADAWRAGEVVVLASRSLVLTRLKDLARRVLAAKCSNGLSGLLGSMLDLNTEPPVPHELSARVKSIRTALAGGDGQEVCAQLSGLLGWGRGLTPSGDDFILGLLLAGQRAGLPLAGGAVQDLLAEASRRTTTLSANLIACAAAGQADERLTGALDGLLGEEFDIDSAAEGLSCWGSSSGLDALAGMTAWFLSCDWEEE